MFKHSAYTKKKKEKKIEVYIFFKPNNGTKMT